jgi:hypothetical protein
MNTIKAKLQRTGEDFIYGNTLYFLDENGELNKIIYNSNQVFVLGFQVFGRWYYQVLAGRENARMKKLGEAIRLSLKDENLIYILDRSIDSERPEYYSSVKGR